MSAARADSQHYLVHLEPNIRIVTLRQVPPAPGAGAVVALDLGTLAIVRSDLVLLIPGHHGPSSTAIH